LAIYTFSNRSLPTNTISAVPIILIADYLNTQQCCKSDQGKGPWQRVYLIKFTSENLARRAEQFLKHQKSKVILNSVIEVLSTGHGIQDSVEHPEVSGALRFESESWLHSLFLFEEILQQFSTLFNDGLDAASLAASFVKSASAVLMASLDTTGLSTGPSIELLP